MPLQFTCGSPSGRAEKLVVFHDSFSFSAIPCLAGLFKTVEFIWTDQADPAKALELEANIVLQILIERKLRTDNPYDFLARTEAEG